MASKTQALKCKRRRKQAPNKDNLKRLNAQITKNIEVLRQLAAEE